MTASKWLALAMITGVSACGGTSTGGGTGTEGTDPTVASQGEAAMKKGNHHHRKHHHHGDQILNAFTTMAGVDGPFINSTAIRGVLGDELPWELDSARGSLTASGHLQITVRGLVFPDIPEVPPAQRGINDEDNFRALVSCVAVVNNQPTTVNIMTAPFPATKSGNAQVDTTIKLPDGGCLAPIIFIMSGEENKWFAVTGLEAPEAD